MKSELHCVEYMHKLKIFLSNQKEEVEKKIFMNASSGVFKSGNEILISLNSNPANYFLCQAPSKGLNFRFEDVTPLHDETHQVPTQKTVSYSWSSSYVTKATYVEISILNDDLDNNSVR